MRRAGSGSLLLLFEKEVDYIAKCIDKMCREEIRTMSVKQEAVNGAFSRDSFSQRSFLTLLLLTDWMEYTHTYFQRTVFATVSAPLCSRNLCPCHSSPGLRTSQKCPLTLG